MRIQFLGHAGFLVETETALIVMDPWLSEEGASDGAWFQFPANHHLAEPLIEKLRSSPKTAFVYLSHEHPDHCDLPFLARLPMDRIHLLYPHFSRSRLPKLLAHLPFAQRTAFRDREKLPFADGVIEFFLEDTGLDCDSSIFVRSGDSTFLNVNDCKLADRLAAFRKEHGPIDVFAAQYSGATWHPVCYRHDEESYRRISETKVKNKFETVAVSIETLEPTFFLPSAGPPCFLDPALARIDEEEVNIFPKLDAIGSFLDRRLPGSACEWPAIMPGDVLSVPEQRFEIRQDPPYGTTKESLRDYLATYAKRVRPHVERYTSLAKTTDACAVFRDLKRHLQTKLDALPERTRVQGPLYFGLDELRGQWIVVDFAAGTTTEVSGLEHPSHRETEFYMIRSPAWQVARAVDETISWEYFSSTFRAELERQPDRYQTILNAFLFLQIDDLPMFSAKLRAIEKRRERIEIVAGGCVYEVDRICPHQGGDLKAGWLEGGQYLVCPKHQWMFDLANGGRCTSNASTIRATRKEETG